MSGCNQLKQQATEHGQSAQKTGVLFVHDAEILPVVLTRAFVRDKLFTGNDFGKRFSGEKKERANEIQRVGTEL